MKTVAIFLALLALAVAACAPEGELADTRPDPTPPFHFNITALPTPLQESLATAAADWNTGTGKTLIVIDPQGKHWAVMGAVDSNGVESAGRHDGVWTVMFEPGQENAAISCRLWFARHAFGHVLQASFDNPHDPLHSVDHGDTMYAAVRCGGILTSHDLASIRW